MGHHNRAVSRRMALGRIGVAATGAAWLAACGSDRTPTSEPQAGQRDGSLNAATAIPTGSENPRRGGTFTTSEFNAAADVLDVQQASHPGALTWSQYTNEGLLLLDESDPGAFVIKPLVIESWEQQDPLTLTLKVRRGMKWANVPPVNGREITANDVVFSLKRMATDSPKYLRRGWFAPVERYDVVDDYTVKIVNKRPFAALLHILAQPWTMLVAPEHVARDGETLTTLVGSGPYIASRVQIGNEAIFERNPDYWDNGKPWLDRWHFKDIAGSAANLAAFRAGQVDFVAPPADVVQKFRQENAQAREFTSYTVGINMVAFNHRRPPYNDLRVRQAIANAIDIQGWIDVLVAGDGDQTGPMSPAFPNWALPADRLPYRKPDLKKAAELLRAAGMEKGFKLTSVTLPAPATGQAVQMKEDLRALNIEVEVEALQPADYTKRAFVQHDYEVVNGPDYSADDPDFLGDRYRSTSTQNWFGYSNARVDQLFEQQSQTLDGKQRRALVDEIQKIMLEDVASLFTYATKGHYFYPAKARGYRKSPMNGNAERWNARNLFFTS